MEKQEALNTLNAVSRYISFGDMHGESRTYVQVPISNGADFANRVTDALAALGAVTTEIYSPTTENGFEHIPVKGKGGAERVKTNLIEGGVNFPGSGLTAEKVRRRSEASEA